MAKPNEGKIAVSPVRLTSRPVISDPVPMPTVSGTSSRPVCAGETPRTTCR